MNAPIAAKVGLLMAALALGACSMPDTDSFRAPDSSTLFRPLSVTGSAFKEKPVVPVTPADLVDASGQCAGAVVPAPGGTQTLQEAGVPVIPVAIALEMTECDVVKRAGVAEKVDIGTNDRRERSVTLTYTRGQRPGIYTFIEGRLKSMELAPETAEQKPAKKPAKVAKPVKRPPANQISVQ